MRKQIIASLSAILLLSGCAAQEPVDGLALEGAMKTTDTTTTTSEATTKTTTATTSTETTTSKPANKATPRTTVTTKAATTEAPVMTTAIPESKTIRLNVDTKRGGGTLTFTSVRLDYEWNRVSFYYVTSDKEATSVNDLMATSLIGISSTKYKCGGIGGVGSDGSIIFAPITNFSDLSTVTLTYAFEGFDPVTVTFDIPGI